MAIWTAHDVSEFVAEHTETDLADRVLAALKSQHGKRITTRIVEKMPGGKDRWSLRRQYGMTHLENQKFGHDGRYENGDGLSLLLGHFESAQPLDSTNIEALNPAYFLGRQKRNHIRMETRNTRETLGAAASAINRLLSARDELKSAEEELDALTTYNQPLSPDKHALAQAMKNGRE